MESSGKKRSKAFYRKCAYGGKKQRLNANVLEPGIRGFLVMCNHNEKSAVRECYNILNEYADLLYGQDKNRAMSQGMNQGNEPVQSSDDDSDDDDVEKALKKEVDGMKNIESSQKRFQNVMTKAKNCVFIRSTLEKPVELVKHFMEDIACKKLRRARYAARILPVIGTCKANTSDIEKLASEVLPSVFSSSNSNVAVPESFTIIFKSRNNNGTNCGREGVVSSIIKIVRDINSDVRFTWSSYSVAILVEIVCTVCCICVAPDFIRLRKYNLQELSKGDLSQDASNSIESQIDEKKESHCESEACTPEGTEAANISVNEAKEISLPLEDGEACLDSNRTDSVPNKIISQKDSNSLSIDSPENSIKLVPDETLLKDGSKENNQSECE